MVKYTKGRFFKRIRRIQEAFGKSRFDDILVYGNEYRKDYLRYLSTFWPIFERTACFIPQEGVSTLYIRNRYKKQEYYHGLHGCH